LTKNPEENSLTYSFHKKVFTASL